jgi:hypothetical protein
MMNRMSLAYVTSSLKKEVKSCGEKLVGTTTTSPDVPVDKV